MKFFLFLRKFYQLFRSIEKLLIFEKVLSIELKVFAKPFGLGNRLKYLEVHPWNSLLRKPLFFLQYNSVYENNFLQSGSLHKKIEKFNCLNRKLEFFVNSICFTK